MEPLIVLKWWKGVGLEEIVQLWGQVPYNIFNNVRCSLRHFYPSLTFSSTARAYHSGATDGSRLGEGGGFIAAALKFRQKTRQVPF